MSRIPSGCKDAPQLWEPINKEEKSIDADSREVLHGVPGSLVKLALNPYYTRLSRNASSVVENKKTKLYFCLWLDPIVYASSLCRSTKKLASRAGHYFVMFIASRYGSIRHQEVWFVSKVLCYFTYLLCGITKFLAIVKDFMNKPGNSMDESGVPIAGKNIDNDRYEVFDVEGILYNVGLVNYKDNNESIYKVLSGHMLYLAKSLTKGHLAN
jgi:hypothetical protein